MADKRYRILRGQFVRREGEGDKKAFVTYAKGTENEIAVMSDAEVEAYGPKRLARVSEGGNVIIPTAAETVAVEHAREPAKGGKHKAK